MKPMWVDFLCDLENAPNKGFVVNQFSKNLNEGLMDVQDAIKGSDLKKALELLEEMREGMCDGKY